MEARRAHNPEVVGSSPASATKKEHHPFGWCSFFCYGSKLRSCLSGYASDERSSLGKRGERRRWREERPERSAAVYIFKAAATAAENIGHRKPGRYAEKTLSNVRHEDNMSPASATKNRRFHHENGGFLNFLR